MLPTMSIGNVLGTQTSHIALDWVGLREQIIANVKVIARYKQSHMYDNYDVTLNGTGQSSYEACVVAYNNNPNSKPQILYRHNPNHINGNMAYMRLFAIVGDDLRECKKRGEAGT